MSVIPGYLIAKKIHWRPETSLIQMKLGLQCRKWKNACIAGWKVRKIHLNMANAAPGDFWTSGSAGLIRSDTESGAHHELFIFFKPSVRVRRVRLSYIFIQMIDVFNESESFDLFVNLPVMS